MQPSEIPTIGTNPVLYNGLQIWREQYCPNIYIPCTPNIPGCDMQFKYSVLHPNDGFAQVATIKLCGKLRIVWPVPFI